FPVVIPLHRADPQTLLTRPPLAGKEASFFPLPPDLHVLGLPPAFNLSHDQTLQLKCLMLKELLLLVHNELTVLVTLQDFFNLFRLPAQIVSCECPHRLSD
ncbi:hypothetical protein, partial [Xenorhabdus miraniensis]|uniref:hypothetical protein n=1 Tax=Xenorhabdus miraniensis TaxID=351674 RepID=UPI001ABEF5A7